MSELTHLIDLIAAGSDLAKSRLYELVFQELRQAAARRMSLERMAHTLSPTALVNEAYIKLFEKQAPLDLRNRRYFYGAAANAMRQVLVDYAKVRDATKRGGAGRVDPQLRVDENESCRGADSAAERLGAWSRLPMADLDALINSTFDLPQILDVDTALRRLESESPHEAELVKLRFFAGLTIPEAAESLEISIATANRYWNYARAWLSCELKDYSGGQP